MNQQVVKQFDQNQVNVWTEHTGRSMTLLQEESSYLIVSDGRGASITEAYSRGTFWRSDHKYDKKREVIKNFTV